MKVSELIAMLQKYPGDMDVTIPDQDYFDWTGIEWVGEDCGPDHGDPAQCVRLHSEAM